MNSFFYWNPTKLVFGKDSLDELDSFIDNRHKKVLLHYGGGSIKKSGLYDKVAEILRKKELEVFELPGVEPNPKLKLVRKGIDICRENGVSFILAVGGGSVIDSAKAIAAGVLYDGDLWSCFTGEGSISKALPLGVILTIPASGSETSPNAVVTNEEEGFKMSIEHDCLRPEFAILNPALTLTLPDEQTFSGILDMISHVLERYFTQTENVELTDNLCEATLKTIINNAYRLKKEPLNFDARAEIMLCGTIAHNGLLGLGRQEDWGTHRIGHELTALYSTTHGMTIAIVSPAWMKYVYKENIARFVRFAENVFGVVKDGKSPEQVALEGIKRYEGFIRDMNLPTSLTECGLPSDDFELIAEKCTKGSCVGSFKKLYKYDVINILKLAE